MIHVQPRPEPATFKELVRRPGRAFLKRCRHPTVKEWKDHSFWTRVLKDLYAAYNGICAYACHWIAADTGQQTVEHFRAKDRYPREAYEWKNYRLVCGRLNGRKGTSEDVIDPFDEIDDWFAIDFPSLLVRPRDELEDEHEAMVVATIKRLKLNDEPSCLTARYHWVEVYCEDADEEHAIRFLRRHAPFLAREIERQGLRGALRDIMDFRGIAGSSTGN